MPPKVVASDLDGTLLTSQGTFDERTKRAIATAEAAGATVVFCTARPTRWMAPLAEASGHHGVAICANGAVIFDLHTDSVLESSPLDPAIVEALDAFVERRKEEIARADA